MQARTHIQYPRRAFLDATGVAYLESNPLEHAEAADDGDVIRRQREGECVHDIPELVDDVLEVQLRHRGVQNVRQGFRQGGNDGGSVLGEKNEKKVQGRKRRVIVFDSLSIFAFDFDSFSIRFRIDSDSISVCAHRQILTAVSRVEGGRIHGKHARQLSPRVQLVVSDKGCMFVGWGGLNRLPAWMISKPPRPKTRQSNTKIPIRCFACTHP